MKKKSQAGYVLLIELLVSMAIMMTILGMTTVSIVKIRAAQNTTDARTRLRQVANAISAEVTCNQTPGCTASGALAAQIPVFGTIQQQGFAYTMTDLGGGNWSFTASPISQGFTGSQSFYISGDMILRCGTEATAPPCG